MYTKSVTPSGTVGKQVYAVTGDPVILRGLVVTPLSANVIVTVRDGNASGAVVLTHSQLSADGTGEILLPDKIPFNKGMHVKVIGASGVAYLLID
jgi:hypothetical protein